MSLIDTIKETIQYFPTSLGEVGENIVNEDELSPKPQEFLTRIAFIPLLAIGGAFAPFALSLVSSISISPIAGAVVGGTFALLSLISSVFCKALGLGETGSYRHSIHDAFVLIKLIADIALTTVAAHFALAHFGISASFLIASLLIPGSIVGAVAIGFASGVFAMGMIGSTKFGLADFSKAIGLPD